MTSGLLVSAANSKPADAPPAASGEQAVTVYYERMPNGTIRLVSKVVNPPASDAKSPNAAQDSSAPAPTKKEVIAASTPPAAPAGGTVSYHRIESGVIMPAAAVKPTEPTFTPTANASPIPTTATGGIWQAKATATAPADTTSAVKPPTAKVQPTQRTPAIQPVAMQQPAVLPGLPPVAEPIPTPRSTTAAISAPAPSEATTLPNAPETLQAPAPAEQLPATEPEKVETLKDYNIETRPPSLERLFRLDSEAALKMRIATEVKARPVRVDGSKEKEVFFPIYRPLSDEKYEPRQLTGLIKQIEPQYVVHGRLYCEELNAERYGWDLGVMSPMVSSLYAIKDFALLPYHYATRPHQRFEASSGKCFPGDPVPYLLYPPELSITGAAWETGIILAGFALIP